MKALQDFYEFLIILNKFVFTFLYIIDSLLFKSEIFLWKITETYFFNLYTEILIDYYIKSRFSIIDIF